MVAYAEAGFAPHRASDRFAMPLFVALIWLGIVMGFGREIAEKLQKGEFAYPLVVHIHAAAFVGWLVFLTTQVTLVEGAIHDIKLTRV